MVLSTPGIITNIPTARSAQERDNRNLASGLLRSFFFARRTIRVATLPMMVSTMMIHMRVIPRDAMLIRTQATSACSLVLKYE